MRLVWLQIPLQEKKPPRIPTYVVKYFNTDLTEFLFTVSSNEI
ncbi:MAG TPA: hypothetical protein VG098_01320 [Nitrososphaera sp.]|nr:hypothetical protein [Nitrososphaera sp.]HEX2169974.1 hypothetical protein [Nitrososphaera sp.]